MLNAVSGEQPRQRLELNRSIIKEWILLVEVEFITDNFCNVLQHIQVVGEGEGRVKVAVDVRMRCLGQFWAAHLRFAGELSSPVSDDKFATRRVFEDGGPMADVLEKSLKAGG